MSPFSGIVITQVMPLHEPLKPVNVAPPLAVAISVTVDPTGKMARQMPVLTPPLIEQATPPGELDTDPAPVPEPAITVTDPGTARRYSAWTALDCDSDTTQLPAPLQAPAQFTNTLPLLATCDTVTLVLSANAAVHVPLTAMLLSAQESPDGVLVSVPPPSDPVTAESASVGGAVNCAVTLLVLPVTIVNVQVVPAQAPVYPENDDIPDGVAVRVTTVFGGNVVLHEPAATPTVMEQLMPLGELATTPVPVPPPVTAMPCVLNTGCAVRPCDSAS